MENVENPAQYVQAVLQRAQTRHIERTYEIKHSDYEGDATEFLSILARKGGRLLRGGEPDVDGVAKMVLNDFLRGKIPWFSAPPKNDGAAVAEVDAETALVEGRVGRLGEMPSKGQKRKRDDVDVGLDIRNNADDNVGAGDDGAKEDVQEHIMGNGDDSPEDGSEISEDNDNDEDGAEEDGVQLGEEVAVEDSVESPFGAFSSDEEEDPGGVPAS